MVFKNKIFKLEIMEKALKEVVSAIESGIIIKDKRGVVYKQEFGEAFLNMLKSALIKK